MTYKNNIWPLLGIVGRPRYIVRGRPYDCWSRWFLLLDAPIDAHFTLNSQRVLATNIFIDNDRYWSILLSITRMYDLYDVLRGSQGEYQMVSNHKHNSSTYTIIICTYNTEGTCLAHERSSAGDLVLTCSILQSATLVLLADGFLRSNWRTQMEMNGAPLKHGLGMCELSMLDQTVKNDEKWPRTIKYD